MTFSQIEALIDRYDTATSALDTAVTDRIGASMDAAFRQMIRELERQYPTWQSQGSLFASQRRLLLLNELGPLLAIVRPEDAAEYERLMAEALQLSHTTGATLADELVRVRDPGYPLQDFATIPIEAAVAQARDGVGRLYRYSDEFRTAASGIVEQGLIQGFGTKKVQGILERELGVAKSKAETLARTETMAALNTASQERYQRNGIEYAQWQNSPSERLCSFCLARQGNVYKVGEVQIPAHPRCRCYWLPWSPRWQERGLTDDAAIAADKTARIAEMQALGTAPNNGPTYWEKKAGLTTAPAPAWKPGDAVVAAPAAARAVTPPQQPVAPVSKMPANHAVTLNPRYKADSIDNALDAIATNGAGDRVQKLREFAANHGVQAVFHDSAKANPAQLALVKKGLAYQGFAPNDATLSKYTRPIRGALGYTAKNFDHVVVKTTSKGQQGTAFNVDPVLLNGSAKAAIDRAVGGDREWSVGGEIPNTDTMDFMTYIHELGHQVHYKARTPKVPADVKRSVTQYGGSDKQEWFAEQFSLWLIDADAYAAYDPIGAKFIEETLDKAIATPKRKV